MGGPKQCLESKELCSIFRVGGRDIQICAHQAPRSKKTCLSHSPTIDLSNSVGQFRGLNPNPNPAKRKTTKKLESLLHTKVLITITHIYHNFG